MTVYCLIGAYPSCPGSHCSLILVLSFSTDIGKPGFSGTAVIVIGIVVGMVTIAVNQGLTTVCFQSGSSKKSIDIESISMLLVIL